MSCFFLSGVLTGIEFRNFVRLGLAISSFVWRCGEDWMSKNYYLLDRNSWSVNLQKELRRNCSFDLIYFNFHIQYYFTQKHALSPMQLLKYNNLVQCHRMSTSPHLDWVRWCQFTDALLIISSNATWVRKRNKPPYQDIFQFQNSIFSSSSTNSLWAQAHQWLGHRVVGGVSKVGLFCWLLIRRSIESSLYRCIESILVGITKIVQ